MLPTNTEKEESKKKLLDKFWSKFADYVLSKEALPLFDFFYSEIEQMEKIVEELQSALLVAQKERLNLFAKIHAQEELLKAADGVIEIFRNPYNFNESQVAAILEKYNQLKQQSKT